MTSEAIAALVALALFNLAGLGMALGVVLFLSSRRWKLCQLVDHLAQLSKGGVPIHSGLRPMARDVGGALGARISALADDLDEGRSLADALERRGVGLPPLLCSFLHLGDRHGALPLFLQELRASYGRFVQGGMLASQLFFYPLLVSGFMSLPLVSLRAGIAPKLHTLLESSLGGPFAAETYFGRWAGLVALNEVTLALCILLMFAYLWGGLSGCFGLLRHAPGRGPLDRLLVRVPFVGGWIRDEAQHQFTLATALLLKAGVALPAALRASAGREVNAWVRERLDQIARSVEDGGRFSEALQLHPCLGREVAWLARTGEAAGMLAEHLRIAAEQAQARLRARSRRMSLLIVPLFVLLNGILVAGTSEQVFLPMRLFLKSIVERLSR